MSERKETRYEFGPFTVVVCERVLLKTGQPLPLTPKEFETLHVLLREAGRLVTKEQILREVWPGTFVGDGSLARNISVLRKALGDGYIQTVSKAGYRFGGAVEVSEPRVSPSQPGDGSSTALVSAGIPATPTGDLPVPPRMTRETEVIVPHTLERGLHWKLIAPIVAVLVLGFGIGGWFYAHRPQVLTEKDTIVLADFTNATGDSVFDGTLRQGLSVELEQSPFLSIIADQQVHQTLELMGRKPDAKLTPDIARELCQRAGAAAMLNGSIAEIGSHYLLTLKAVNCASGESMASAVDRAADKNDVLNALANLASEMRRKLGESLGSLRRFDASLQRATTPSLEALQAYDLGKRADLRGDDADAIALYQRAIQLDPNFAMAYDDMAYSYQQLGETILAAESDRKAFNLRGGVTEWERLIIEGDYYNTVPGDIMKARRAYALGEEIYPREVQFHADLGVMLNALGDYDAALKEHVEVVRLSPYTSLAYRFVAYTYLLLGRVSDAEFTAGEAHTKGMDSSLGPILYAIAFYRNDSADMSRQLAAYAGKQGQEDLLLALHADTAAYFGHLRRAREFSREASDSAKRAGDNEAAITYDAVAALREAAFGNVGKTGQTTMLAKEASGGRDKYYAVVLALAYAGYSPHRLVDDFSKHFPEDTIAQVNLLPTLRAKVALNNSKPEQALHELEAAAPYELGLPAGGLYNWPNLYPAYVRGEAYLAAHQGEKAAAEFQKIIDHRGVVLNEPIGALAHLQLARAYALQDNTAKAKAAYQDFLTLWKDADPDIPILLQAKAEYAKLS